MWVGQARGQRELTTGWIEEWVKSTSLPHPHCLAHILGMLLAYGCGPQGLQGSGFRV